MTPTDFQALRKSMGHTQHTLAESLGMGAHGWQTISAWENGKRDIPGPVKIAIDHLANCRVKKAQKGAVQNSAKHPQKGPISLG